MVHTRFFDSQATARIGFDETKDELGKILALIPLEAEADDQRIEAVSEAISDFFERCQ